MEIDERVADYKHVHPGGKQILEKFAGGKDMTAAWFKAHNNDDEALARLKTLQVGKRVPSHSSRTTVPEHCISRGKYWYDLTCEYTSRLMLARPRKQLT